MILNVDQAVLGYHPGTQLPELWTRTNSPSKTWFETVPVDVFDMMLSYLRPADRERLLLLRWRNNHSLALEDGLLYVSLDTEGVRERQRK